MTVTETRARCSRCSRVVALRLDGLTRKHRDENGSACHGSNTQPALGHEASR